MIVKQIKAILKNKSNFIYIIFITVIFIILNIIPNLGSFIDSYYDLLIDKYLKENVEMNESYYELAKYNIKTLLVSDNSISINTLEELLKDIQYFQRIYIEPVEFAPDYIVDFVYIELDDWKYCPYVKKYLDDNGIATSYNENANFYNNYEKAKSYSNIITYFAIILSFAILIVSCNNIVKNESKNLNLLSVIGYSKKSIRNVIRIQILSVLLIGCFAGIFISKMIIWILINIINLNINKAFILRLIINLIMLFLPTYIATGKASYLKT